jgi:hypothetical protein
MEENPKANPGRQPCKKKSRKNGESDLTLGFAGFQQAGLPGNSIPRDRGTTLQKNKKEWGLDLTLGFASFQQARLSGSPILGDREKILRKNKKAWGVRLNPQVLQISRTTRVFYNFTRSQCSDFSRQRIPIIRICLG